MLTENNILHKYVITDNITFGTANIVVAKSILSSAYLLYQM